MNLKFKVSSYNLCVGCFQKYMFIGVYISIYNETWTGI